MIYQLNDKQPKLPENYWVADNATVIGNVEMHEYSSIWFNAVIRGDNDPIIIGECSNIQDHAMIHTDLGYPTIVGANVTVGHSAVLHGCKIGNYSLIGIGATVLNGAEIGDYCLIGAGALITEGKKIPDGSLVMGSPGKVVKQLSDEQRKGLEISAQVYVDNYQRFAKGLRPIK